MTDPNVLVGTATGDDAAVYRLDERSALVSTLDFFTPIVDDPVDFGRIAAANAFSDIWAMGAKPLFALSIVGFPRNDLPLSVLQRILEGANEVAAEAGAPIVGGHSIDDPEPKFGLAVTGIVEPQAIRTNAGGRDGDRLILTKPLGTGVVTTGIKRGLATEEEAREVVAWMRALNRHASEVLAPLANALTDVTGYGLLGHLRNVCRESGLGARIRLEAVPILPSARRLAGEGVFPGGTRDNLAYQRQWVDFDPAVGEAHRLLLADAQTNGGLLAAVPAGALDAALEGLRQRGIEGHEIGGLEAGEVRIRVG